MITLEKEKKKSRLNYFLFELDTFLTLNRQKIQDFSIKSSLRNSIRKKIKKKTFYKFDIPSELLCFTWSGILILDFIIILVSCSVYGDYIQFNLLLQHIVIEFKRYNTFIIICCYATCVNILFSFTLFLRVYVKSYKYMFSS